MDFLKVKRRCNKSNPKHIKQPTTGQERTQEIAPFLFAHISEREKETTKTMQDDKQRQPEQRRTKNKKQEQRDKNRGKERKRKANTQKAFYPPNLSRTQKPHKPREARKQYEPTQSHQNPLKPPKNAKQSHICKQRTTSKARERTKGGNTPPRERTSPKACTTCTNDKPKAGSQSPHIPHHLPTSCTHLFKYIFAFRYFWSRKIPRKHQSTPNKI